MGDINRCASKCGTKVWRFVRCATKCGTKVTPLFQLYTLLGYIPHFKHNGRVINDVELLGTEQKVLGVLQLLDGSICGNDYQLKKFVP